MSKLVKPVIEGWFTQGDAPALIGARCGACGTYHFPKTVARCANPECGATDLDEVELSRRGRLWSYAENQYAPPEPYVVTEPFEPYTIAAVELERERMTVLGQMPLDVPPDTLRVGDEVELVVDTLYEDDDCRYTVWKWRPVPNTSGPAADTSA